MKSRNQREVVEVPEWSPLYGKPIKRVNARRFKDRAATEKCIFDTLTTIVRQGGLRSLRINELSRQSKVSKELIYRYFKGLDGAIKVYAQKHIQELDNSPEYHLPDNPTLDDARSVIKAMYRARSEMYYKNMDLRVVIRDYLFDLKHSQNPAEVVKRPTGLMLRALLAPFKFISLEQIEAFDSVVLAAHGGLILYMDCSPTMNGIPLRNEEGRERIHKLVDDIIDDWLTRYASLRADAVSSPAFAATV